MLCFAATCVATLYHYVLGWQAPYALTSLPVLLGTVGGIGLLVGPAGLLWLNLRRHPAARRRRAASRWTAASSRCCSSPASPAWPCWPGATPAPWRCCWRVHLGVVMALFLTLPYGKFAHGVYRSAALLKYAIERRQPNPVAAGAE